MTQMICRALRGRKAGGADEANIVMFTDEWKRLIDWATPLLHWPEELMKVELPADITHSNTFPSSRSQVC
jgi:hypothetical protein